MTLLALFALPLDDKLRRGKMLTTAERAIPHARRELTARMLREPVLAEGAHVILAGLVWLFLRPTAAAGPLAIWVVAIMAVALIRAVIRWRAARDPVPDEVPGGVRVAVIGSGLTWGLGAAYFATTLPLDQLAIVMVVLVGITGVSTSTLVGDPPSYYGFNVTALLPFVVALATEPGSRGHTSFLLLIVLFGGVAALTYHRTHTILRRSLDTELVLGESRARANQQRRFLDHLVESVPNAVVVLDRDETVLRVNPAFEALFGFPASEVVGRLLEESIVPVADRAAAAELRRRVLSEGILSHESERRTKSGNKVYVRIAAARIDPESGMSLVLYDDITDRRMRERRAAAENAVTRALSEAKSDHDLIPVVLIAVGHHLGWGIATYWRVEPGGRGARCTLSWADDRATRDRLFQELRGSIIQRGESAIGRAWAGHSETWVPDLAADANSLPPAFGVSRLRGSAVAMPVDRGWETIGILAFVNDDPQPRDASILETIAIIATQLGNTMDRIRAEAALREAETQYRQLVEAASDVVWRIDGEGRFTFVNEASRRVWGWPPRQLVGQSITVLTPARSDAQVDHALERLKSGEELHNVEVVVRKALGDDELIHMSVSAIPVRDVEGNIIGAQGIARDIGAEIATREANQAARAAAEQAAAAKSAFLANMSHEIRTPLTGILGLTDLVLSADLSLEQRRSIELIAASGESLLRIINDILDLSKIEAHQLELELTHFDLSTVVDATAALLSPAARTRGVNVIVKMDPSLPKYVHGDSVRLGQVLSNLVGNAIKFTSHGRIVVTVRAEPDQPDCITFSVRDTGIGIEPEAISRIFEPFRQADVSTTRMYGGTGLGLSIARRLVDLMGGEIQVESNVGVGSDFFFTIRLPAASAPSGRRTDPRGVRAIGPKMGPAARALRILIAEDNPVNQEVAATMLRRRGHTVFTVSNGREAVDALATNSYDVVLMDLQMPQLDGVQATTLIRNAEDQSGVQQRVAIIALTANALAGERERCIAAGMDDYLAKPYRPADLIAAVEAASGADQEPDAPMLTPAAGSEMEVDIEGLRAELTNSGVGDALDGILRIFIGDSPKRMSAIEAALASHDAHQIVRAAHAFKSSAGTIRARHLARALQGLEDAAREGDERAMEDCWNAVQQHFQATMERLTERVSA